MNFNPSKRKILTVSRKKPPGPFRYILGGNELARCNEETDLGIKMSNNLKWESQVMQVVSKANKMLGLLRCTCYSLTDQQVRKTFYLSLVESQFSYGTQVWSLGNANLTKRIEGLQRRATLRILQGKRGEYSYTERLKRLYLLSLSCDREIKDLTFYFKCRYNLIDVDVDQLTLMVSSRTRQESLSFFQTPYCKTNTFQQSYFYRIVKLRNFIFKVASDETSSRISSLNSFYKQYTEILKIILILI